MLIIPQKKNYMVLEFGKLEYCRNKIFCILFIKCTRAWYTRVLCCMVLEFTKLEYHIIFFNRTNPIQQFYGGRTDEELEFLKLEFRKKWYFAIYFQNSVFLLKISKKCDIFFAKNVVFGHLFMFYLVGSWNNM